MNLLIIFAAKYLYILIGVIAVATFVLSNQTVRVQFVKLSIFTFPFSLIVAWILNALIQSPRPFIVENIQPLIQSSPDNGFPSDHTLLAMTIASVIYTYNKKIGGAAGGPDCSHICVATRC